VRTVDTEASDISGNGFDSGRYGEGLISLVHYISLQILH